MSNAALSTVSVYKQTKEGEKNLKRGPLLSTDVSFLPGFVCTALRKGISQVVLFSSHNHVPHLI